MDNVAFGTIITKYSNIIFISKYTYIDVFETYDYCYIISGGRPMTGAVMEVIMS